MGKSKSVLNVENIFFENINFKRSNAGAVDSVKTSLGFSHDIDKIDTNRVILKINCFIANRDDETSLRIEDSNYYLSIDIKGTFFIDDDAPDDAVIENFLPHMLGVLLPILRGQVLSLTSQLATAVVFPLMNTHNLLFDTKNNWIL